MLDFSALPLTPDQARAARNFCGMTQAQAGVASGLPAYKIKRFEMGNTILDTQFLDALRAFYEGKGFVFPDTERPGANAKSNGSVFPAGVVQPGDDGVDPAQVGKVQATKILHIRIDPSISIDEVGRILDHIEHNERAVAALLNQKIDKAQLLGLADAGEAIHGTAVRLLSENGSLLAKLFGRPLVEALPLGRPPRTHAELLARTQASMLGAIAGNKKAMAEVKAAKSPSSLKAAIFD